MRHRKEIRKELTLNFRVEPAFRDRLDRAVQHQQEVAPIGVRLTLGDLCRGLLERGLNEIERGK
jgi:hypothetical protein